MSGTTIGEVNINLRMSLAQFKTDTADGTRAASAATKDMANEIGKNSHEASASLALIGEQIGVNVPRHLRSFITSLPGVSEALNAAFNSVAILALIGVLVEAAEKVKSFWESLGKLSEAEQKMLNDATKGAKELLEYQTTLLKAEFDLQIAKAQGLDKDKLRVAEMTALVGLNSKYVGGLQEAKDNLQRLLDTQTQMAEKYGESVKNTTSPFGAIDLGSLFKSATAEKSAETTKGKIEELTNTIGLANAALQEVQASAVNAGTTLAKDLSDGAEKSRQQLDKISDAVFKLQSRLGVPTDLQINMKVDPQLFQVGAMLEKIAQPQLPAYSGTKEAEDLYKIQHDMAAAIAESQKVYTETRTSAQALADEEEKLFALYDQGRISLQQYNVAVSQAKAKYDDVSIAARQFGTDIMDTLKTGALWGSSWRDTLQSLAIELTELILKMTLLKSLQQSTAATGEGGFFSSLLGGLFGGGKASGGPVEPGQYYEWQEKGHEYFAPGVSGSVIPAGAKGDGGPPVYNISINGVTDFDSFRKSKAQLSSDLFAMMANAHRRHR